MEAGWATQAEACVVGPRGGAHQPPRSLLSSRRQPAGLVLRQRRPRSRRLRPAAGDARLVVLGASCGSSQF